MIGSGRRVGGMFAALAAALVAAGCGTASSTSTSTTHAAAPGTSTPASSASSTSAPPARIQPGGPMIPAGSAAVVVGTPITWASLDHWMLVAAKTQASQSPGQPVIVPDPPGYERCVAQVRKQLPRLKKSSVTTLTADCRQLYQTLSNETMDFLVQGDWIQADGARQGIVPTDAQVERALATAKQKRFPTESSFKAFLSKTGQSVQDMRLRFRINLILRGLMAREKGSTQAKESAVTRREKRLFAGQTRCTALVLIPDCGNYRKG